MMLCWLGSEQKNSWNSLQEFQTIAGVGVRGQGVTSKWRLKIKKNLIFTYKLRVFVYTTSIFEEEVKYFFSSFNQSYTSSRGSFNIKFTIKTILDASLIVRKSAT